jgi:hypothetical protein
LVVLSLAGCASTVNVAEVDEMRHPAPGQVFVGQFAYAPNDPAPDQSILKRMQNQLTTTAPQTPEEQAGLAVAQSMQNALTKDLTKDGIPVTPTLNNVVPQYGSMVIEGELLTVKDGSSFQRLSTGLAGGQTQVISHVEVYRIGTQGPVLMARFYSNANSSVKPGVATLLITPVGKTPLTGHSISAVTVGGQSAQADAARTAKQIARKIDQVFENEGWIFHNRVTASP